MNVGNVVKNAGSHRILYSLSFGPRSSTELKKAVGAINSIARFDGEYMHRLVENGYAIKHEKNLWVLTAKGSLKIRELGPIEGMIPRATKSLPFFTDRPYVATELTTPSLRPGANTHKNWPSRMGKALYYMNGTVIKDGANNG